MSCSFIQIKINCSIIQLGYMVQYVLMYVYFFNMYVYYLMTKMRKFLLKRYWCRQRGTNLNF